MKVTNLRSRFRNLISKLGRKSKNPLAAAVVTGGLLFSGGTADAANLIQNGGFETPNSGWTNQGGDYTHPYGGINGPQLTDVGTLNDYGFNNTLSADAGTSFHGLAFPTTQTVNLVNSDLSAADILAGEGRFAFSSWLATCCNDVPEVIATFNDGASTSIALNRGIATHMQTTADVLVNPLGANNAESLGVNTDANRRYWALYEFRGLIPTDATEVTITVTDGRANAAAAGASTGGNGNDNYADMMIFDAVQSTEALTLELEVNKTTGAITILNNANSTFDINFYEIASAGGTLNSGWTSLADQNTDSLGPNPEDNWQEGGGSSANLLTEAFLTGSSGFAANSGQGGSETLSSAYSAGEAGDEDLVFRYALADGTVSAGVVTYTTGGVVDNADFDNDGDVDGDDFLAWQTGYLTNTDGDANNSGTTDGTDFGIWSSQYGSGSGSGALSGSAVPEPTTFALLGLCFVGLAARTLKRKNEGATTMATSTAKSVLHKHLLLATVAAFCIAQTASATVTNDRIYRLGDSDGVSANTDVAFTSDDGPAFTEFTATNAGMFGTGTAPTYVSTSSRPMATGTELGVRFNAGGNYVLQTDRLGLPESSIGAVANGGPSDFTGIANRGFQFWVNPTVVGGSTQDIVMDTTQHGVRLSSAGNWVMVYANGTEYDSGVSATANQWYHVMMVRPNGAANGAQMYVNGVAVAAAPGGYNGADDFRLVLGGSSFDFDPTDPVTNSFTGIIDDVEMFVMGVSTDLSTDYGTFDYTTDNPFAADALSGVAAADVNMDSSVNLDDVNVFVTNWLSENLVNGVRVGDLASRAQGDLNLDGIVNLADWSILNAADPSAGAAVLAGISGVPEPGSLALFTILGVALLAMRKRRS